MNASVYVFEVRGVVRRPRITVEVLAQDEVEEEDVQPLQGDVGADARVLERVSDTLSFAGNYKAHQIQYYDDSKEDNDKVHKQPSDPADEAVPPAGVRGEVLLLHILPPVLPAQSDSPAN